MNTLFVTAIAVGLTVVAASSSAIANNIDSKDCDYYGISVNFMVHLSDIVVKQGEIARPTYSFSIDTGLARDGHYSIYFDLVNDYCIDNTCYNEIWSRKPITALQGFHMRGSGTLDLHKIMLNKGTFNSTYRLHSNELACDVTAVGTIFVQ